MARKKSNKKPVKGKTVKKKDAAKPARAPAGKPAAKPAEKKPGKIVVTSQLRRLWFRVRRTYDISLEAFSNALASLSDEEAEMLYELVRHSLFKGNVAQILREHPEMREFVKTDDDRICMHDIYEHLSWRLGKKEPIPQERAIITRFRKAVKGSIIP